MSFNDDSYLYLNPQGEIWIKGESDRKIDPYNPPSDAKKYFTESFDCSLSRGEFSYMISKIGQPIQTPERPVWSARIRKKDDIYIIGLQDEKPILKKNNDYFTLADDLREWSKSIQYKCFEEIDYVSLPQLS